MNAVTTFRDGTCPCAFLSDSLPAPGESSASSPSESAAARSAALPAALKDLPHKELTELRAFLLGVLRPLVRNEHDAEDIVQGVLLKALSQSDLNCVRAWTRTVAHRDGITLLQRTRQRAKRLGRRIDLDRACLPADSPGE